MGPAVEMQGGVLEGSVLSGRVLPLSATPLCLCAHIYCVPIYTACPSHRCVPILRAHTAAARRFHGITVFLTRNRAPPLGAQPCPWEGYPQPPDAAGVGAMQRSVLEVRSLTLRLW